jgi:glutathione S-transferase
MTAPTLVTIPFSHYCEKARWALDRAGIRYREEAYAPVLHVAGTVTRGGRSTPLLRLGRRSLTDSRDILAWIEEQRPGLLLPEDPGERAEVDAWQARFDRDLGTAARRIAYHSVMSRDESIAPLLRGTTQGLTRAMAPWIARAVTPLIRRGLRIDDEGARRSRERLEDVLGATESAIGDGRRYLVGGRFTAADLTFAALYGPLLAPPEQPITGPLPLPPSFLALRTEALDRPAGRFAARLYREERSVVA